MAPHVEIALIAGLVGVGLLLNPLYLYPDGGGHVAVTYDVESVESEADALDAVGGAERVLTCPGERACALETTVHEEGTVEYDDWIGDERRYEYVRLESGLYRPVEGGERGGPAELSLESATPRAALADLAVPASELSPAAVEAAETGSATVVGDRIEPLDRGTAIQHDGEYYTTASRERRSHWTGSGLAVARLAMFVFGGAALVAAGGLLRADAVQSG